MSANWTCNGVEKKGHRSSIEPETRRDSKAAKQRHLALEKGEGMGRRAEKGQKKIIRERQAAACEHALEIILRDEKKGKKSWTVRLRKGRERIDFQKKKGEKRVLQPS